MRRFRLPISPPVYNLFLPVQKSRAQPSCRCWLCIWRLGTCHHLCDRRVMSEHPSLASMTWDLQLHPENSICKFFTVLPKIPSNHSVYEVIYSQIIPCNFTSGPEDHGQTLLAIARCCLRIIENGWLAWHEKQEIINELHILIERWIVKEYSDDPRRVRTTVPHSQKATCWLSWLLLSWDAWLFL